MMKKWDNVMQGHYVCIIRKNITSIKGECLYNQHDEEVGQCNAEALCLYDDEDGSDYSRSDVICDRILNVKCN